MANEKIIEFSKRNSLRSNTIGMRAAYGLTLLKIKEALPKLSVFTADTSTSAGLDRFKTNYPESFFDCGISEQCMIASAAGYVSEGGVALASTFAPFLILRAAEQIRLSMGYMELPLIITGLASGVSLGYLGYTHCCVEDLPYLINVPNIFIYSPSDAYELSELMPHIIDLRKPTYIRLTGASKVKPVHQSTFTTNLYSPIPISKKGNELLLLSTGSVSSNAKDAIDTLSDYDKEKISHYVVPFFDQPKTLDAISELLKDFKKVLVIDESMFGGLSSYCLKAKNLSNIDSKIKFNCHPEKFLVCGEYDFMLNQCGLSVSGIKESIKELLS